MKTYHRFIAMLLAGVLFLSCVPAYAMTTSEKENNYNAAILQLETYLSDYKNDSAELYPIYQAFSELRGYEQSKFLGYYVTVLIKISDNEYDYEMRAVLNMIERNKDFDDYLSDNLKGSPIGTVEDLAEYVAAREYEYDGDNDKAIENYEKCLNYYDASDRYYNLVQSGDETIFNSACDLLRSAKKGENSKLVEAYHLFSTVERYKDSRDFMASIVDILGYTPSKEEPLAAPPTSKPTSKPAANPTAKPAANPTAAPTQIPLSLAPTPTPIPAQPTSAPTQIPLSLAPAPTPVPAIGTPIPGSNHNPIITDDDSERPVW